MPKEKQALTQNTALALVKESEDTSLVELNQQQSMARSQQEVQGAIVLAKRFPRNEDQAFARLQRSCQRPSFAESVEYAFPRGGKEVRGPSADLAREAARCWGNIRYGTEVVSESKDERHIRSFAWDLETNNYATQESFFKKRIQRKVEINGMKETRWVEPDERDLLELHNRIAAKAERNCILKVLPPDYIQDAIATAHETLRNRDAVDPDASRKRLIVGFGALGITPEMLGEYLGHPLAQCSPAEFDKLRGIWKSIKDGNSTWAEYAQKAEEESQEVPPEMERIEEIVGLLSWTEARRRKFMAQYKGRMKEALEFLEAELNKDAGGAQ